MQSTNLSFSVDFEYKQKILGPILYGNRVVGIKTDKGDFYADLVIDACGLNSPIRRALPLSMGIQNNPIEYEQFYIYRAFFNKACEVAEHDKFKVILLPNNELGIFNRLVDVYVLACAIGIKEDKVIYDADIDKVKKAMLKEKTKRKDHTPCGLFFLAPRTGLEPVTS